VSVDTTRLTTALADRYRLVRELGRGGMATVYLVRDVKHDREVALKLLRPEHRTIRSRPMSDFHGDPLANPRYWRTSRTSSQRCAGSSRRTALVANWAVGSGGG
jgi:serine/threonine protein kinase